MRKTNPSTCRDASLELLIFMNSSVPEDSETQPEIDATARIQPVRRPEGSAHLDPITGEPHAHPVGVGVGAFGVGTTGALIGAILGPVGAVIGAALGAVAGGLAGKEVAETSGGKATAAPEESTMASAGDVGGGAAPETPHDHHAELPPTYSDTAGGAVANSGDNYAAGNAFLTSAEPVEEAPAQPSGPGHVTAASMASDVAPTASGFSGPAKAADPVAEDVDRQAAPETVPFSAAAAPGDDFTPQRLPLTPEDTDVHIASVPNDLPKIDEPKGPLNHDLLFEHGEVSDSASQSPAGVGSLPNTGENTSEATGAAS